jgi:hypothetical protein
MYGNYGSLAPPVSTSTSLPAKLSEPTAKEKPTATFGSSSSTFGAFGGDKKSSSVAFGGSSTSARANPFGDGGALGVTGFGTGSSSFSFGTSPPKESKETPSFKFGSSSSASGFGTTGFGQAKSNDSVPASLSSASLLSRLGPKVPEVEEVEEVSSVVAEDGYQDKGDYEVEVEYAGSSGQDENDDDVEEIVIPASPKTDAAPLPKPTITSHPLFRNSSPKVPSKLRFSSLPPEHDNDEAAAKQKTSTAPPAAPIPTGTFGVSVSAGKPGDGHDSDVLPVYRMSPSSPPGARGFFDDPPLDSAPSKSPTPISLNSPPAGLPKTLKSPTPISAPSPAANAVASASPTPPPVVAFNWAAAGIKPPDPTSWTCKECMCTSPASATKCTVCEAER